MAWDDGAKTMAVNVIAKVEGGGAWDAINYGDPITIGLMQWFGTRAAKMLRMIKDGNPTEYGKIANSVRLNMANWADTDIKWTSRYLTVEEGRTIKPVLRACKDIQGQHVASDVEDYKKVCDNIGLNANTNTNTAIFFMCMYHQTPQRAINIMKRAGMSSSIDRVHSVCMNDKVFRDYKNRYNDALRIIKSGVPPTIIDLNDDNEEQDDATDVGVGIDPDTGGETGQGGSIFDSVRTGIKRIEVMGDQLLIHIADGKKLTAVPTGGNNFIIKMQSTGVEVPEIVDPPVEEVDPTPSPDPDPPTGDDKEDIRLALVKFMTDRTSKYGYSQGPSRLTPDSSGVTDCSALVRYAYLSITKKDVGTYTDAQVTSKATRLIASGGGGTAPSESYMKKGDLVITRRHGTRAGRIASHVEMYMGNGRIIGHGGVPYMGPVSKDLAARTKDKEKWWVKRLNSL